jgi:hypothetical protein
MPYPREPPTREVVFQELAEILDRPVVTERRSRPRLFGDDTSGEVVRRETRRHVQALDLASELQREVARILGEDGELDARGAGVQNEDRVIRPGHRCRPPFSSQLPYRARRGGAGRPKWPREKTCIGTADA